MPSMKRRRVPAVLQGLGAAGSTYKRRRTDHKCTALTSLHTTSCSYSSLDLAGLGARHVSEGSSTRVVPISAHARSKLTGPGMLRCSVVVDDRRRAEHTRTDLIACACPSEVAFAPARAFDGQAVEPTCSSRTAAAGGREDLHHTEGAPQPQCSLGEATFTGHTTWSSRAAEPCSSTASTAESSGSTDEINSGDEQVFLRQGLQGKGQREELEQQVAMQEDGLQPQQHQCEADSCHRLVQQHPQHRQQWPASSSSSSSHGRVCSSSKDGQQWLAQYKVSQSGRRALLPCGSVVDLVVMLFMVRALGGCQLVTRAHVWDSVALAMGLPASCGMELMYLYASQLLHLEAGMQAPSL
jgi:hypothetical protein